MSISRIRGSSERGKNAELEKNFAKCVDIEIRCLHNPHRLMSWKTLQKAASSDSDPVWGVTLERVFLPPGSDLAVFFRLLVGEECAG